MVSDVEVRQVGPDDIAELYQVTRRSRREAFGDLLPSAALDWESTVPDAYREIIEEILANDEKALLVEKQEGSIVGLAELVWDAGETAGFVDDTDAELVATDRSELIKNAEVESDPLSRSEPPEQPILVFTTL